MLRGLRQGGYDGKTEVYDWTAPNPGLPALLNTKHNHEEAEKIASRMTIDARNRPPKYAALPMGAVKKKECV